MTIFQVPYLRFPRRLALGLLWLLAAATPVAAGEAEEYRVKAAMIYNMIRFMDWPEETLAAGDQKLSLCLAGSGPFATAVLDTLPGKQVKGKALTVRQLSPANDPSGCQVLVLSDLDPQASKALMAQTRTNGVLTIADSVGFAEAGGVVGFVLVEGKVRFEINQGAAQRHRIRISAQLLKLAKSVLEAP